MVTSVGDVRSDAGCPPAASTNPLREPQPVHFRDVTLNRALGAHPAGAAFAAATVNFLSGRIA
eukprot:58585-Rhodomonas_salina.1